MKCDNIKLCKINILVSTFRIFDNRSTSIFTPNNLTLDMIGW